MIVHQLCCMCYMEHFCSVTKTMLRNIRKSSETVLNMKLEWSCPGCHMVLPQLDSALLISLLVPCVLFITVSIVNQVITVHETTVNCPDTTEDIEGMFRD